MEKIFDNFDDVVADIFDGATVMIGGAQGPIGRPANLIRALGRRGTKGLTLIANSTGEGRLAKSAFGYPEQYNDQQLLFENGQVKKLYTGLAFLPGRRTAALAQYEAGELEIEHLGHGNLVLGIWAGAAGVEGVYSPVGVGTEVEKGKEKRVINGKECILIPPLRADFAIIWAYKADKYGNLIYWGTGRNVNAVMAKAANVTIAEVEEIVEVGELDPEVVVTPGIYVHRLVKIPKEDSIMRIRGEDK